MLESALARLLEGVGGKVSRQRQEPVEPPDPLYPAGLQHLARPVGAVGTHQTGLPQEALCPSFHTTDLLRGQVGLLGAEGASAPLAVHGALLEALVVDTHQTAVPPD